MNKHVSTNYNRGWLFKESQQFRQWWLWSSIVLGVCLIIYGLYSHRTVFTNGVNNDGAAMSLITFTIIMLMLILFAFAKLETIIDEKGIHYKFFPFNFRWHVIAFTDIREINVRQYSFIEYGGWGIRWSIFGKGWAYNISGNKGLQIIKTNGRKFLIGTQRPDEISNVLEPLRKQNLLPPSR